jgi:hypothetical protein
LPEGQSAARDLAVAGDGPGRALRQAPDRLCLGRLLVDPAEALEAKGDMDARSAAGDEASPPPGSRDRRNARLGALAVLLDALCGITSTIVMKRIVDDRPLRTARRPTSAR